MLKYILLSLNIFLYYKKDLFIKDKYLVYWKKNFFYVFSNNSTSSFEKKKITQIFEKNIKALIFKEKEFFFYIKIMTPNRIL